MIGTRVVTTTSASCILSTIVAVSEGVDGYSVYVCLKDGEKVGEGVWIPSRRTMCGGCEGFMLGTDVLGQNEAERGVRVEMKYCSNLRRYWLRARRGIPDY